MRRISKSELANKLALTNLSENRAYTWLLADYFTDELLHELGIDQTVYKKIRVFTAKQTKVIMNFFKNDFI